MNKILTVVDMQNDFISGTLGSDRAREITAAAAEKIRGFYGKIFVTMDTHGHDYMTTHEGRHLPVEHCIKNTHGWELCPEILDVLRGKDFTVIEKPSFGSAELINAMKPYVGSDTKIELIGLCTDICVISNALLIRTFFPENDISVDSGCCAGVTPLSHEAALTAMRSCQINVY
jgi:nicotinamidase/pyrazinamidase